MTSSGNCNNLPVKLPQFFKVILENTMQDKKLGIPKKFVMEYGNEFPECVILEVPDGAQWNIKLSKTQDGQVWMKQGWLDFGKHYSISYGHFLVFNPQGVSKFLVVIFDTTGMEIKYPPMATRIIKNHIDRETELQKNHELENAREDSPLQCDKLHKRKRAINCESCSSVGTECGTSRLKMAEKDADVHVSSQEFDVGARSRIPRHLPEDVGTKKPLNSTQKAKSCRKAKDFKFTKPYFEVIMQLSSVYRENKSAAMNVPASFAKKYLTNKYEDVDIHDMKGRTWVVSYFRNLSRYTKQVKFRRGWRKFAKDNNLRVGDVCVFEMDNCKNITFKVIIFRKSDAADCLLSPGKSVCIENGRSAGGNRTSRWSRLNSCEEVNKSEKVKYEADTFTTAYPWFFVEIKSSYLQGCLTVPSNFAKIYIKTGASTIKLNVGDKSWRVKLFKYRDGACRLSAGWSAFTRENFLKLKDVCRFELIEMKDYAFKVSISRNTSNPSSCIDI